MWDGCPPRTGSGADSGIGSLPMRREGYSGQSNRMTWRMALPAAKVSIASLI